MSHYLDIDKKHYKCYYNDMNIYSKPTQIQARCAEITFYNKGTSAMLVNGIPFVPGVGIAFDGREGELDITKYNITFKGPGTNAAWVIQKMYTQ
jgi:hypothetical protein